MHVVEAQLAFLIALGLGLWSLAKGSVLETDLSVFFPLLHLLVVRVLRAVVVRNVVLDELIILVFGRLPSLLPLAPLLINLLFAQLLLLSAFGLNRTSDAQLTTLELQVFLVFQSLVHALLRVEHDVANTFANVSFWVSDEPYVFDLTTVCELCSKLLLTHNEW